MAGVTPSIKYIKKIAYPKASQIYESIISYIDKHNPERIYGLTATPTRNPMCVYGIAKILGSEVDFYKWRSSFYIELSNIGRNIWTTKKDNATKERLGALVRELGYTGQLSEYHHLGEFLRILYNSV